MFEHLSAQIDAGVDVVQLFDSWAGVLPEPEFARWCEIPARQIIERLKAAIRRCRSLRFRAAPASGISGSARRFQPMASASIPAYPWLGRVRFCPEFCLQGNLDPAALVAGAEVACREAKRIIETLSDRAFVFNLGHGVLPQTDPDAVGALVDYVKSVRLSGTPQP